MNERVNIRTVSANEGIRNERKTGVGVSEGVKKRKISVNKPGKSRKKKEVNKSEIT